MAATDLTLPALVMTPSTVATVMIISGVVTEKTVFMVTPVMIF